jgi:anti-sigma B factor antagonist
MADDVMLELRREMNPDRAVVYCSGRLVSTTADILKAEVKPLIVRGRNIVLDLSDLSFMDSMGLGTIASLWVSAKSRSCELVLVNLSPRIRDLFTVTHLLSLFEACGETNAQIP